MATSSSIYAVGVIIVVIMLWITWKVVTWLWLRPKKLERMMREQGLQGTSYKLLSGDSKQVNKMLMEAISKPMINLSDDIATRVFPFFHHLVNKYGKNPFMWNGLVPSIIVTDPDLIKEILNNNYDFTKTSNPFIKFIATGLARHEGNKWAKHRRMINPAFNLEKLKVMLPTFLESCNDMVSKWKGVLSTNDTCEMDVWPFLQDMTSDVISRTAFGSNFEEGKRIFQLLREQAKLIMKVSYKFYIPGWRFLPTASHRRMKKIAREIEASLKGIINKREKAMKEGKATKRDLLDILLESNHKEIQEHGNTKNVGMTIQDVIEECKTFYFAGQETTSVLLVWTMVLLSRYPDWQKRAREEVLQVFGNQKPDFDGLSQLKIVTMIFYEVLRLYPPVLLLRRSLKKDMKLGNLTIPRGVDLAIPIVLIHHDIELWGDDAKEFKPERFSEGILKATKGQVSFFPFGWGPRICIGQNFALLEAKMAVSMILQRFSFELSPAYVHAPVQVLILQPQYGANLILHKL